MKAMQLAPDFINMNIDNINAYADNLFSREPSIMELTLVNSAGMILSQKFSSAFLESEDAVDLSKSHVFHELERKQSYISPPEISNATQLPYIMLGEPILGNAGAFAGAILVKLDLGFIRDLVSKKRVGDSGYLFIISEKGKLISHPSLREFYQNPDYSKYEYVNEIIQRRNGSILDEENLVSFYTNEYGWTTVVEIPAAEALAASASNKRTILSFINATLQSIAYFTVLIILFGFIIATVTTVFITKRMITPILNFTNAARRISQGEFSTRIEKQSNDELGEFTDSFNKMTEEIKREREELIKANELIRDQAQEIIQEHIKTINQSASLNISEMEKPLIRVKSFLAEIKMKGESNQPDNVNEVIDDVEQINLFLKDLFEHSKITTDASNFKPVDFSDACAIAIGKLAEEIKQSGARVHYENLPTAKALQMSIVQLFENLFSNAIKYRNERPLEILVSAEDKGETWQFMVSDNGIGIDPYEFSEIFHVRESGKSGMGKFNFGLALCKNIVERHGGKIWLESHKGKGTTFFFTLEKFI